MERACVALARELDRKLSDQIPYLPPLRFFASIDRPMEKFFTEVVKAERPSREADLWMEAQERLAQMDVLVCRAKQLQDQHWIVGRAQSACS